jgi:hypothetical protein
MAATERAGLCCGVPGRRGGRPSSRSKPSRARAARTRRRARSSSWLVADATAAATVGAEPAGRRADCGAGDRSHARVDRRARSHTTMTRGCLGPTPGSLSINTRPVSHQCMILMIGSRWVSGGPPAAPKHRCPAACRHRFHSPVTSGSGITSCGEWHARVSMQHLVPSPLFCCIFTRRQVP